MKDTLFTNIIVKSHNVLPMKFYAFWTSKRTFLYKNRPTTLYVPWKEKQD